jgi:magnesium chelatase family protein
MKSNDIEKHIFLTEEIKNILNNAASRLELSARSYHNTIKLARTIADLSGNENIEIKDMLEALQYRQKSWLRTN